MEQDAEIADPLLARSQALQSVDDHNVYKSHVVAKMGNKRESLSKTKPDKMYQPPKMYADKAKMNEMNTFYLN